MQAQERQRSARCNVTANVTTAGVRAHFWIDQLSFTDADQSGLFVGLARCQYLDPRAGRITFGEWAKEWLGRPGKRANSIARDRQGLDAFTPHLGARPLASITPMHVQAAVDERGHHCSPATLARDDATVRAVFNAAVDADLIARSPARKVALPKGYGALLRDIVDRKTAGQRPSAHPRQQH